MVGYLKFCAKINEIQRIVGSDINRTIGAFVIIKSVISQKINSETRINAETKILNYKLITQVARINQSG
jgi:hypothetical protein